MNKFKVGGGEGRVGEGKGEYSQLKQWSEFYTLFIKKKTKNGDNLVVWEFTEHTFIWAPLETVYIVVVEYQFLWDQKKTKQSILTSLFYNMKIKNKFWI